MTASSWSLYDCDVPTFLLSEKIKVTLFVLCETSFKTAFFTSLPIESVVEIYATESHSINLERDVELTHKMSICEFFSGLSRCAMYALPRLVKKKLYIM